MKAGILYMAAILGMVVSFGASAQVTGETFDSYIEISGYAEQEVAPDVFYLRIVIDEQDGKGRFSLENQEKEMIKALRGLGIDTDGRLTRLSLSSRYYKRKNNLATGTYQLKLNGPELVSKALGVLDNLGISDVAFTKAEYSGIDSLRNEVSCRAVRNARDKAKSMAEAVGQNIGRCFYMYVGHSGNAILYAQPRMTKSMTMDASNGFGMEEEEIIDFNNIKVSANVNAKFVLE
ncbi:MAG: SIMPL domain-containing protein [Bacteroidales bacterium]|nr:SIMPL domain-containing protein [Candidatus Cryptobacteroides fimicaballi]